MIEKYPLYWPEGKPRTEIKKNSRFETSFGRARDGILLELSRMNAGEVIISSNIPLRKDGLPYSNSSQPFDTGVAVYFTYKKKQHCFACDLYRNPTDNMQAIMKTIQALRGIARWGTGDMMEQAFRGFEALASGKKPWWEILGVDVNAHENVVIDTYLELAKLNHPDHGGSNEKMAEINQAYQEFRKKDLRD